MHFKGQKAMGTNALFNHKKTTQFSARLRGELRLPEAREARTGLRNCCSQHWVFAQRWRGGEDRQLLMRTSCHFLRNSETVLLEKKSILLSKMRNNTIKNIALCTHSLNSMTDFLSFLMLHY